MVNSLPLPVTRARIGGYVIGDCLLDSGSQKTLIDSRILGMIAPQEKLGPAPRLISASGHPLKALGTCNLPVTVANSGQDGEVTCEFTVVDGLTHDCIFGWDFLQCHGAVLDCSNVSGRVKVRLKRPVRIPPKSVSCLCVKTDQPLTAEVDYVFTGQQGGQIEFTDALVRPYSGHEMPLMVRNRSDRFVNLRRRDVIGYMQLASGVDVTDVPPDDSVFETNAVSAGDSKFLGKGTDEILELFKVGEGLKGSSREKLASLLQSFPEVFSESYSDIGCYNGGEVDLEVQPGTRPQFAKPYPVPWAREKALGEQLQQLQASGVVAVGEPSDWNSPVILVSKGRASEFRIVQDMRQINKHLLPKKFVLPSIDDFLYSLQGWNIASSLDIKHAFWNLRLSQESQKMCAFYALGQTFYPLRMPMGCAQSSYFLHVVMHRILGDLKGVSIYADDVLLTSTDIESHLKLLHDVLERLSRAGLKLSPNKCSIGMRTLSYLGHQITPEGVSIDPERVRCITDLEPPRSVKEAKRIYGFYAWFRKFIPSFSSVSAPLARLANSDSFYWNDELEQAFQSLRLCLLSDRVLAYPTRQEGDRFILYTDSSTVGSGQILCQIQGGVEKVIAFNGSKYSKAQTKWTIYELELFSFITGLKKFYKYLSDTEFIWRCDCKSALQIIQSREEVNPRIVRWRAYVSQFRFLTEHRPATAMRHVDMLSRVPETTSGALHSDGDVIRRTEGTETAAGEVGDGRAAEAGLATDALADGSALAEANFVDDTVPIMSRGREEILWYQKHDRNCRAIVHGLKHGKWPRFCPPILKREKVESFSLQNGILCRRDTMRDDPKVVWPVAKRFEMMYKNHDVSHHAHGGSEKLFQKLSQQIWYPGLKRDCSNYVSSCKRCSRSKDDRGVAPPPLLPQPAAGPGDILVVDVVHMPSSRISGKTLVLTCVDKFTGFLTHYPLPSGSAESLTDVLTGHFLRFGPPRIIETDAGANMKSQKVWDLCRFWDIHVRHGVAFHHEAVGKIERRHRDIKRRLRALSDSYGTDWESHLAAIVFSLNTEVSSSHDYSPYFLYFMRNVNTPGSHLFSRPMPKYSEDYVHERMRTVAATLKSAHDNLRESQCTQKRQYDLRHRVKEPAYKPGDRVRIRNFERQRGVSQKMEHPWSQMYTVVGMCGRRHVECVDPETGRVRRTHVRFLKPVYQRNV